MSNATGKRDRASLSSYSWIQEKLPVILAAALAVVFVISLIPILYVSFYAHPLYDDFGFSKYVHSAVVNGGGVIEVIAAAFKRVAEAYSTWQGTFSAILIFSLQPGAFSDDLYFLTTFIMVFSLTLSTIFFIDTIAVRWMKSRRSYGFLISLLILFCSIQFVIDKQEAFYWFNGASYYTLFYSLALVLFALLIRMYLTDSGKKRIALFVGILLLAAFIGGGNYTTGLITAMLLFLTAFAMFFTKNRYKWLYLAIFAVFMISFVISMVSPGNSVRAAQSDGMSAVKAIAMSVFYAAYYIGQWTDLQQIAVFLFLLPTLYSIAKKAEFSFRYPLWVILFAFLCFAAQLTPPLYAMSSIGSGRQINIYYYSYYLLILFSLFYLCGWVVKSRALRIDPKKMVTPASVTGCVFVLVILFGMGCFEHSYHNLTSVDTALAIMDGSVYEYDAEYEEAIEKISSGETYVEDIETVPDFFGALGISDEDDYWVNRHLAEFFDVDYFYLKE